MSYRKTFKTEDGRFWTCFEDIKWPPQPCEQANLPRKYLEIVGAQFNYKKANIQKQEEKPNLHAPYNSRYYKTAIGESSNTAVSAPNIKQEYNFPKKCKLEPKLELSPSHPVVLVGCTKCYRYLMLPSSNPACPFCHKRAHTVEELENK